jgi:hypothetical protein
MAALKRTQRVYLSKQSRHQPRPRLSSSGEAQCKTEINSLTESNSDTGFQALPRPGLLSVRRNRTDEFTNVRLKEITIGGSTKRSNPCNNIYTPSKRTECTVYEPLDHNSLMRANSMRHQLPMGVLTLINNA